MSLSILLTSFATWKPEQASNSSDDLVQALMELESLPATLKSSALYCLRSLPVDFQLAPETVLAHIDRLQPDIVCLCGMAEQRPKLSLESRAIAATKIQTTPIDLSSLVTGLQHTEISHDAGRFVCNGLYYLVLAHLQQQPRSMDCLFVHVPVLTPENQTAILSDFCTVLTRLAIATQ